jgi:hypothetical protein
VVCAEVLGVVPPATARPPGTTSATIVAGLATGQGVPPAETRGAHITQVVKDDEEAALF